jgi:hypothetical protein
MSDFSYLTSRRYVSLFIGLGSLFAAGISSLSGVTIERFRGFVYRDREPKRFWGDVVTLIIIGLFSLASRLLPSICT